MENAFALRAVSGAGLFVILGLAWLLSENRRRVSWRAVIWGIGLQIAIGMLFFWTFLEGPIFRGVEIMVSVLSDSTAAGAAFVFSDLANQAPLAFQVLPVIIFVSALSAILYHLRVIQAIVRVLSWLMRRTMKTSGAETLAAALLIFVGIEATAAIRAYLRHMTRSELCTVMTTFLATIAGSVMIIYAQFTGEAGHLLAASLMSAPAAIAISKLMVPEAGQPKTAGNERVEVEVRSRNLFDAATQGTADGLRMALYVAATLIVYIALVYMLNLGLSATIGMRFESIIAWLFRPFAWIMGIPLADAAKVSQLLGIKTVLNEFLAYDALRVMIENGEISKRSVTIATYALCGFANPGSIGIMIAGLDALVPERRADVTQLSLKAFIGGTLACFTTACVAGLMIYE